MRPPNSELQVRCFTPMKFGTIISHDMICQMSINTLYLYLNLLWAIRTRSFKYNWANGSNIHLHLNNLNIMPQHI